LLLGEEIPMIGDWFKLYFTENYGMAFGMQFGGEWGKLSLSIFRIFMIMAGALGNIIDSAFYGLLFTQSSYHTVAEFAKAGEGYAGFLHGRVVDMLYFPIINLQQSELPAWIPDFLVGYDGRFVFFRPIFNLADSSITIGVFWLLLFERKHLSL